MTTLPPAQIKRQRKSTAPKLSFHDALSRWFLTAQGEPVQVGESSSEDFAHLVMTCLAQKQRMCPGKQAVLDDSLGLDYTQQLDRWYILLSLLDHAFSVPLHASREEAQQQTKVDGNVRRKKRHAKQSSAR